MRTLESSKNSVYGCTHLVKDNIPRQICVDRELEGNVWKLSGLAY